MSVSTAQRLFVAICLKTLFFVERFPSDTQRVDFLLDSIVGFLDVFNPSSTTQTTLGIKESMSVREVIRLVVLSVIPASYSRYRDEIRSMVESILGSPEIGVRVGDSLSQGGPLTIFGELSSRVEQFYKEVIRVMYRRSSPTSPDAMLPLLVYVLLGSLVSRRTPTHPIRQVDAILDVLKTNVSTETKIQTLRARRDAMWEEEALTASPGRRGGASPDLILAVINSVGAGETNNRIDKASLVETTIRIVEGRS